MINIDENVFTPNQLIVIGECVHSNLSDDAIQKIANPAFSSTQMRLMHQFVRDHSKSNLLDAMTQLNSCGTPIYNIDYMNLLSYTYDYARPVLETFLKINDAEAPSIPYEAAKLLVRLYDAVDPDSKQLVETLALTREDGTMLFDENIIDAILAAKVEYPYKCKNVIDFLVTDENGHPVFTGDYLEKLLRYAYLDLPAEFKELILRLDDNLKPMFPRSHFNIAVYAYLDSVPVDVIEKFCKCNNEGKPIYGPSYLFTASQYWADGVKNKEHITNELLKTKDDEPIYTPKQLDRFVGCLHLQKPSEVAELLTIKNSSGMPAFNDAEMLNIINAYQSGSIKQAKEFANSIKELKEKETKAIR